MEYNLERMKPHTISIEERKRMQITGVTDVESFDEQAVQLSTPLGELTVKGIGLHIGRIDVNTGELELEGEIWELSYSDSQPMGGGLFSRLFR